MIFSKDSIWLKARTLNQLLIFEDVMRSVDKEDAKDLGKKQKEGRVELTFGNKVPLIGVLPGRLMECS